MFSAQGHLDVPPKDFLAMAQSDPRRLVNDYLLAGTPFAFKTYDAYCRFRNALARELHVHPCAILIRGSARLGYSTAPRVAKAWKSFSSKSDIDVAIVDVDYFNNLDSAIREWESRQRFPNLHDKNDAHATRQRLRYFNCVSDKCLPPSTCDGHRDIMVNFDTLTYCDVKYEVSAFVFRDWWSLRNRCEHDLQDLCWAIKAGKLPPPP